MFKAMRYAPFIIYKWYLAIICYWNWFLSIYSRTFFVFLEIDYFFIKGMKIKPTEELPEKASFITLDVEGKSVYFNINDKKIGTNLQLANPFCGIKIHENYYSTKEEEFLKEVIDNDF